MTISTRDNISDIVTKHFVTGNIVPGDLNPKYHTLNVRNIPSDNKEYNYSTPLRGAYNNYIALICTGFCPWPKLCVRREEKQRQNSVTKLNRDRFCHYLTAGHSGENVAGDLHVLQTLFCGAQLNSSRHFSPWINYDYAPPTYPN